MTYDMLSPQRAKSKYQQRNFHNEPAAKCNAEFRQAGTLNKNQYI